MDVSWPFSFIEELRALCFSSLFFLSFLTFSSSSSSSSASNIAALASKQPLPLPPPANDEKTNPVIKLIERFLFVILGKGAGVGDWVKALQIDCCCLLELCLWMWINVGFDNEEEEDGDEDEEGRVEERKLFAVERNCVAIFLFCVFVFFFCVFW